MNEVTWSRLGFSCMVDSDRNPILNRGLYTRTLKYDDHLLRDLLISK